ncbi:DUF2523 family protein [Xenorhabdus szentirmaii]|uniref:Phage-related membrane protein n=1 Tax=Xenorhabdus szentirmaii DSM 16338 TaxID=1427518 RepID=W1IQ70_9GAMM|nr:MULTISPECIES: DUF2523 family protein [Xenorhabdus]MBD2791541.1 DUF2523 domain-containing protein [Xenorhabdus sp. CUL]MBD2821778.1 DUF2523 domain-containing protein [Xenorhabdus sp. 42]PHM32569.1 hypothetical protein Xsze_03316 [Xenorhabdus szentirmaii DSM 16338]PHM41123.1 hypothetical protein Xszus_00800 [Xenorhabdus szentirmaii]CDL80574.1 putative phage-related membrane protein [Xenorhabdus szentirmaii DSM 16338]
MYGFLLSALNTVLTYLFRAAVLKFIIFFSLYFIVKEFMSVIVELLPKSSNFQALFDLLPDSAWYFINLFQGVLGINLLIDAWFTRFIIRRLPFIG